LVNVINKIINYLLDKMRPAFRLLEKDVIILLILAIVFVGGLFVGKARLGLEQEITDFENPYELFKDISIEGSKNTESILVAVDSQGHGVAAKLYTEVRKGSGLVLVNINNVLADVNAQYSARIAKVVAENISNMKLDEIDIVFNIVTNATVIGGQSAGGAMALSVLSLLLNKEINESVMVTGAIDGNGSIKDASEIFNKAKAAKDNGGEVMLVPPGLSTGESEFIKVRKCGLIGGGNYCETRFVEREINIGRELAIKVIEVTDVREAMEYYFI
jgi:predicted S18 family serine protease